VGDGLLDAVRDAMHDRPWVEVNFAHPRRDEALFASWERFCEAVQYETRYVFWLREDEDEEEMRWTGEIPASRILDELGGLIETLDLVRDLPAGYRLWRARVHSCPAVSEASELGTAPREFATRANRMNPAGIPMFYGAQNIETAVREAAVHADEEDRWVTVGAFETSRPCTVVDFTNLPEVPSMFDLERDRQRRPLLFLHKFVDQLSKPPRATEYEPIDYVPTQIVTEYLLRVFAKGQLITGLLYASVLTNDTSVVLDVSHDQCVDQEPRWEGNGEHTGLRLGLVPGSLATQPLPEE